MSDTINENKQDEEVVTDFGKSQWSDLWKKEDYWAIWLGFIILIMGAIMFLPQCTPEVSSTIAGANA